MRCRRMEAKELGHFIADLRKEKQMTQAELAERLHVTDKAVSRWERGIGYPDINTLEPLADALGITLTELMNCARDEEKHSDEGIIASLEIARSQRKRMVKRIAGGGVLCIAGMFMLLYARKLFMTRTWTFMLPGNDGPTAVFVAGRIGNFPPAVIVIGIIGGAALVLGIVTIIRANNTDH